MEEEGRNDVIELEETVIVSNKQFTADQKKGLDDQSFFTLFLVYHIDVVTKIYICLPLKFLSSLVVLSSYFY